MSSPTQATSSSDTVSEDGKATHAPPTNPPYPYSAPPNNDLVEHVYDALSQPIRNASIENTTTKTAVGTELSLAEFEDINWVDTYNEEKQYIDLFPDEQAQVRIWRTGNLVVSGPSMPEKIVDLIARAHGLLREELDIPTTWHPVEVRNVVASFEPMGDEKGINLPAADIAMSDVDTEYNPEMFSGLVCRSETGTANVYSTGRSIVTGVESTEQARQKHQELIDQLDSYGLL